MEYKQRGIHWSTGLHYAGIVLGIIGMERHCAVILVQSTVLADEGHLSHTFAAAKN